MLAPFEHDRLSPGRPKRLRTLVNTPSPRCKHAYRVGLRPSCGQNDSEELSLGQQQEVMRSPDRQGERGGFRWAATKPSEREFDLTRCAGRHTGRWPR